MKSIFEYIDYRKYLADYYAEAKNHKPHFSYRYFAQKAGLNAPILLKMVMDGKRNLTRKSIEKFCKGLGLVEKEAHYFTVLVLFNQAKTALEKGEHYRTLREHLRQVPQKLIETDGYDYYDKWYMSALREGVCQQAYGERWEQIAKALIPPIRPEQAQAGVQWLLKNGFIKKQKGGRYSQVHKAITTLPEVKSLVLRNLNRQMIGLAQQSLDNVPLHQRFAAGITLGLTAEGYALIVAETEAFRQRVVNLVDALEEGDAVYQLNIQLFPLMLNTALKNEVKP